MNDNHPTGLHLVTTSEQADGTCASTDAQTQTPRWFTHGQDLAFLALKAALFLASTWLMAFGLPLLFFLALSGGDLDQLFWQVDNLASRWIEADAVRKDAFSQLIQIALIGSATLILIWRMPRFLADLNPAPSGSEQEK
tara:strand:+ start:4953 stop:5369 length:417 start_codon:yes stop_codon:yes gene_type:complete